MLDGAFGPATYGALTAFQRSLGTTPTGVLSETEMNRLDAEAREVFAATGFQIVPDPRSGLELGLPVALVPNRSTTKRGTRWSSPDGSVEVETIRMPLAEKDFGELYELLSIEKPGRAVTYSVIKESFFVVSGTKDDRRFYLRFRRMPWDSRGFSMSWNPNLVGSLDRIAIAMSNALFVSGEVDPDVTGRTVTDRRTPVPPRAPVPPPAAPATTPATPQPVPPDTEPEQVAGSGFVVSAEGYVATNAHVVKDCREIVITGRGSARLIRSDTINDLAIIKFDAAAPVVYATLRRKPVDLGDDIYVLGFPLAPILGDALTISSGIVSSLSGIAGDSRQYQISASVQPGNSGGPVVDAFGGVAGIVVSRLDDVATLIDTGSLPQNVNFAIRAQLLEPLLQSIGVTVEESPPGEPMTAAGIAAAAKGFTVQIVCSP